jgi:hypothetical protein
VVNDVFQIDELVDVYRVTLSIDVEENLNFRVVDNIFVNVDFDVEEINDVLNQQASIQ